MHLRAIPFVLGLLAAATLSAQEINEFPLPAGDTPWGIASGPDGALWFADYAGAIGRITTGGSVTEYALSGTTPFGIVTGPDGNLWFTTANDSIWRVTT